MKYPFSELLTFYAAKRGFNSFSDMNAALQIAAKKQINGLLDAIWYWKQFGFSGKHYQRSFIPPYVTGTVSGTAGSNILTGSSTSWPNSVEGVQLRGQFIILNSRVYKIAYRRSTTVLILDGTLADDISAGSTYKIYFLEYPMPWDFGAVRMVKRDFDYIYPLPEQMTEAYPSEGVPEFCYDAGLTEEDFLNGTTVTTVNNSNRVTHSTTVSAEYIGLSLLLQESNGFRFYRIVDVDTVSNYIFLDRPFVGTGASGVGIVINPRGLQKLAFKLFPVNRALVDVKYTFQPTELIGDGDMTLLPTDSPMLAGIEVIATKWETVGDGNINEVVFADKKFVQSLKALNLRGTPLQNKMFTDYELNMTRRFPRNTNPWNSWGRY